MNKADSDLHSRLMMARLPAMPQILLKLLEQCQSEDIGMSSLAELVAKDPAIACKILGIANSSAYHRGGKKFGLENALATLGTDLIKTLVISESVFQVFNGFAQSNGTDLRSFWKHALTTAVMAGSIARKMGVPNVEEAYLAGLLHDVGRLALLSEAHAEYAPLFFAPDNDELCSIEHSLLKLSHPEIGAWLADRWQLDSFLSDSLRYHHESMSRVASAPPLIRIVVLAQLMSIRGEGDPEVISSGQLCGLQAEELLVIYKESGKQVTRFAELLGIDLTGADELTVATDGWNIAGILAGADGSQSSVALTANPQETRQNLNAPAKRLAEEVANMYISTEIGRSFSSKRGERTALLDTIVRSARLLFSFSNIVILRVDQAGKSLVGIPIGDHKNRMSEFTVALAGGGSIADSAIQRKVSFVSANEAVTSLATEQLLRILDSEALVCLPISAGQRCVGVLIGGIAPWQATSLRERERFLKSFADQASILFTEAAQTPEEPVANPIAPASDNHQSAAKEIVHEANNALSIIKNYLGVLDSKLEKKGLAIGELSILHEEIDRVGQIIKGFSEPKPETGNGNIEVNRVIQDVVRLLSETQYLPPSVTIHAQTTESPCEIAGGSGELKQILVNLIKNGIEAMPDGGEIEIVNSGQVNVDGHAHIELIVRDNGPGIAHEVLNNLFSPGQTTKAGTNRGLGLSIVHGLVKRLEGSISCRSNGKGTSFVILLPVRQAS